jgi:hypothetical protein
MARLVSLFDSDNDHDNDEEEGDGKGSGDSNDDDDDDDGPPLHHGDDTDDDDDDDPFGLSSEVIDGEEEGETTEKKSLTHWKVKWSLRQRERKEAAERTANQRGEDHPYHATASFTGHRSEMKQNINAVGITC